MKMINFSHNSLLTIVFGLFSIIFLISSFPNVTGQSGNISELESLLENNPKNLDILLELGVAYYHSGMCEKALPIYDEILKFKPNYPEVLFGKATCFVELGMPEESISILNNIDSKFANDNSILIAKGNSYLLLRDFNKAEEYYLKVLENNPNSNSAFANLVLLAKQTDNHVMAEKYIVNLLGNNPTPSEFDPELGNMPYTLQINTSERYTASVQVQIRNSSDELIAVVESEKILYIPHPFMYQIIDNPSYFTKTVKNEYGTFQESKIVVKTNPPISPYFLDRVMLSYEGYLVFFAYNMSIPIEEGDYVITEWNIKKKIEWFF